MALIDIYRKNVENKNKDILKLVNDKSKEMKKALDAQNKIKKASDSLRRTNSQSTIKSKLNEINRYEGQLLQVQKKISNYDNKIAQKRKELHNEQSKLLKEEEKVRKKIAVEQKKREKEQQLVFNNLNNSIEEQRSTFKEVKNALNKLTKLPEKIVVLFLASNPLDAGQLRLDEEARAIEEMIKKSKHRDAVIFKSCWAVRPFDVLQAINENSPTIIHFSGHGSSNDEIVFQDNDGNAKLVSKNAIIQTMMASSDNIRLVFFNTCYSKNQAEAVVEHVEAAIGMNTSIGDDAARVFSSQFYSSIGFGLSIEKAFNQAKALLMLENIKEENTPELFVNNNTEANKLVLVDSEA